MLPELGRLMAYTQADLDAIDAALKSGAVRVEFPGGGATTYRSVDDMLKVRKMMSEDVASTNGTKPIRRLKVYSGKDL